MDERADPAVWNAQDPPFVLESENRELFLLRGSQGKRSRATGNPDKIAFKQRQSLALALEPLFQPAQLVEDHAHFSITGRVDFHPVNTLRCSIYVCIANGKIPPMRAWLLLLKGCIKVRAAA